MAQYWECVEQTSSRFAFLHTVWVNDNVRIIFYLEPLPESFVMVGASQGLAQQLHVGSGSVYLVLMESRWASYDSSPLQACSVWTTNCINQAELGWSSLHRQGRTQMVLNWEVRDGRCSTMATLDINSSVKSSLRWNDDEMLCKGCDRKKLGFTHLWVEVTLVEEWQPTSVLLIMQRTWHGSWVL